MYIKRNLEATIHQYLSAPEILAIVGPRQTGKTSMVSHIFKKLKKSVSLTFEDVNVLSLFEKNINDFIAAYVVGNEYLFIDEFQYAHTGGKLLKYIYDTQKIKIVISGSSAVDLTVRTLKHLVGRILVLELYPFDFREYLLAVDEPSLKLFDEYRRRSDFPLMKPNEIPEYVHTLLARHYSQYLLFGGYPRVVLERAVDLKKEILKNIYNTYFLREVRDILGLIDDYKLSMLLKGLSLQIGNLIEYNELSRLSGFSFNTLKKYMNFFEKTFICRMVRPYFTNKRSEIVKNPKVFFFDTGLRNVVADDFRALDQRLDAGALLENGIAMQTIKKNRVLHYWRDKKKHEIDFVISREENTVAIESKRYARISDRHCLDFFKKFYPTVPAYVSYLDADPLLKKAADAVPIYLV